MWMRKKICQVQTKQAISSLCYPASSTAKWVLQYLNKIQPQFRSVQSSTWSKLQINLHTDKAGAPPDSSVITDIPGLLPPEWRTKVHVRAPQVGRQPTSTNLFFSFLFKIDSNHTFFHVDLCLLYSTLLDSLQLYVPASIALIIQSQLVGDHLSDRVKISPCAGAL